MRSLALLAQLGSLQAVAERCHLTSGAVHQHLKSLEGEMGTRLYRPTNGRLDLTPAGHTLLPFIGEILAQHDAAISAVRELKEARRGLVRVGAGPSFSSFLLPPLVRRFRRKYPGVEVFCETGTSGHLLERLHAGVLDIAFDIAPAALDDPVFAQVALWKSQAVFVARRDSHPAHCRLNSLEKDPFILFHPETRMGRIVQSYLDGLNFRPRVVMRSDSSEAIKAMIRAGLGISVLFAWNINADLRAGSLAVIRTEAPPLELRMALIERATSARTRAVEEFVNMARTMKWQNLHPE